jgi:Protein O-mannosyl-transferase TMEM260-like
MEEARRRRLTEALVAGLAGLIPCAVYLRTLYPGLNGIGDTPKFQFLGRILGTPHPPGYPVYLLLCAAFARLPFGNLAWRANLLSAVAASAAALLLYRLLRRLACRPLVALATALAFAFGRVLWSQATLAEVYALAAALLAAVLLATLRWEELRTPRALDLAVFMAALSLAHHTSVAMVAPALVLYVLATDRRAGLSASFLGRAVLLVALGLSPYLLILQRNLAGAPYLGARARNLAELWDVMRGTTFEARLFAFDAVTVLTDRIPRVASLVATELTLPGAFLLLVGLFILGRRQPREALLLGLSAAGLLFFALNYDVPDLDVFLVPAFVPLFALAGAGLEAILASRTRLAPVLGALSLAWPGLQLVRNFKVSDHSDRTYEGRYFAAIFEALPERAAIAAESYTVDHMVLYELLGEGASAGRDLITIPADADSVDRAVARGYSVFAFERTRTALEALGYAFTPVRLQDAPLPEYKAKLLPRDRIVLEAGLGRAGRYASIGPAGDRAALERAQGGLAAVRVVAGEKLGDTDVTAPVALRAESLASGAAAFVNGVEVARSESGIAFAAVGRTGKLMEAHDLRPEDGFRVPFTTLAFPFHRLVAPRQCVEAGGGAWVEATEAAERGRLRLRVDDFETYEARVVLWLGSGGALAPRVSQRLGTGAPSFTVDSFAPEESGLREAAAGDAFDIVHLAGAPHLTRVELRVNDRGDFATLAVDLHGLPGAAWVRADVDRKSPVRALACAATPGDLDLFGPGTLPRVGFGFGPALEPLLAGGWNDAEPGGFRWSSSREALLLLPLASVAPTRVRVRARPLALRGPPMQLRLAVGGTETAPVTLRPGWGYYEWELPAAAWRVGTNLLAFRSSAAAAPRAVSLGDDSRSLSVAFSTLELRRDR